jgi:chromate transporter
MYMWEKWKKNVTIFCVMFKIGCFTFGGGWGIVAQMQEEFADRRHWVTEQQILDFMSVGRSLPGLMIMNISVMFGYTVAGPVGALSATLGLSTPALLVFSIVTYFYTAMKQIGAVSHVLNGVRGAVIPVIIGAAWKLKGQALVSRISYVIMAVAFFLCTFTSLSKPMIVILGAVFGLALGFVRDQKQAGGKTQGGLTDDRQAAQDGLADNKREGGGHS